MVGEFGDGEEFEDEMTEHPLPALAEDPDRDRGEEPLEGVEEASLSGIDDIPHAWRNSFYDLALSIMLHPHRVKRKMIIKSCFRVS